MNILYIGPNESEWAQAHCPGSLAASKWSRGLLSGLSHCCRVTALTHTYYYPWPKGRKIWSGRDDRLYPPEWECEVVSYPVLKYVREWWWRFAYAMQAKRIVERRQIDVALLYNCYESWKLPVMKALHECGVRVVPIVLDGDDPRKDNWRWLKRAARYADAFAVMSWWVYQNFPVYIPNVPVCHFDGGADGWVGGAKDELLGNWSSRPFTLVHTGSLDKWRGLDFMVEVVRKLNCPDIRFVFCGKDGTSDLGRLFGRNAQVSLPGFLPESKMRELCRNADLFLNVRNPSHPDNILNYPSKLPHYLSFGHPVVSTRLASLSPDYAEVVQYPDNDTVESYVEKVNEVLGWSDERRQREFEKTKSWFLKNKLWDVVSARLVSFLEQLIQA